METKTITISYNASVFTQAGWRGVEIKANVVKTSEKMAKVVDVVSIDGAEPTGYTSRTGAKRQVYNALGVALRELGKNKRLSSCNVI